MNNILNELNNENNKALKALHNTFNFNYNKPIEAIKINGKFTVNQVCKALNKDPKNALIVIMTKANKNYWSDKYFVAKVDKSGIHADINVDLPYEKRLTYESHLDDYRTKKSFEEMRKREETTTYAIAQDYDNLSIDKPNKIDMNTRYTYRESYDEKSSYYRTTPHYQKITVYNAGTNRPELKYHVNEETTKLSDIIDKSGYLIDYHKHELYVKARELVKQHKKEAYLNCDNSNIILEIGKQITDKQMELVDRLKAAMTSEELLSISDKLGRWKGLTGILDDYTRLKKRVSEKSYSSIDDFNYDVKRINEQLAKI